LGDRFCLAASIDGFLAIAKLMFESNRQRSLLESIFYSEMLQMSVSGIAMSRFHCGLDENQATVIRSLALVSQSAAEFLLFGDTELHDNLHIHAKRIGQTGLADDQLFQDLIHRMVLRYLSDDERNLLLGRIDGRQIEAQVFRIRIAAAHANGLEFAVETLKPVVRLKASEQIRKGQMISGSPGLPIHVGTLMVHLQEYDFAQAEFDQILLNDDATDEDRFAALNNKGLVLLEVGKPDEAAQLFKNAIDLAPERTEPRKNLELAERAAKGKLTSC
jgi:tetratricopeptide (TPR) repeat protein